MRTRNWFIATIAMACVANAQDNRADYQLQNGAFRSRKRDDYYEVQAQGGFRFAVEALGLSVRGDNLLILHDLETMQGAIDRGRRRGLPTRGLPEPAPRRRMSPEAIRRRLQRTLATVGEAPQANSTDNEAVGDEALRLFRYLYCEGDVVVVQRGVEVLRCDRMWISPIDDRIVVENAEIRYQITNGSGRQELVVRGPRLIKQGPRWVGEDLTITTDTSSTPSAALHVGEAEIIERPGEFEVISRGQTLQLGGIDLLPIPDARIFTGDQSAFLVKSVSGGYSNRLGAQVGVVLGAPWNQTGGAMHRWLTGRPADEFRGEWELGVGWIQERGVVMEPRLTYGVDGRYEGWIEGLHLNDGGVNVREIRNNLDGTVVDETLRTVARTANRVHLGERTHLDLQAFQSSDPSIYSEFYIGPYRRAELPETSAYLHHADENHLLTIGTRFNLNDFSYRDDRSLADRFIEELPVMTYQWLAQPVATTPWETPIVLDLETQVGQRRSAYDDRSLQRASDRSLRADQHIELSAPFRVGSFNIRPYASGRGTFFDDTPTGDAEERVAMEAGVQVGTRLSRTWSWLNQAGERDGLRHVIAPRLTYRNRYHVDDSPTDLFQYDDVDATRLRRLGYDTVDQLVERELVRFEVRNVVQKMVDTASGRQPRDVIFVDLAQDLLPNRDRDNNGDTLGLLFYDVLFRPSLHWLPLERFVLAHYGDLDWKRGVQTSDTELTVGPVAGLDWTVEYREDNQLEGVLGVGARTQVFGRWSLFGRAQRDLERDELLNYSFGISRRDQSWIIGVSATYNPFIDEATFRLDFQPTFAGMRGRRSRFGGASADQRFGYVY